MKTDCQNRQEAEMFEDSSHGGVAPSDKKEEAEVIAKKENNFVFALRLLVVTVLVLSAIAVCLGVYSYATNQEKDAFQARFHNDASKVLEGIGTTFEQTLGSTDAFITQLIAYARYSNSSWPFVTMPAFAIHATKLLKLSKAFYFSVYPFVEPWQLDEWLDYTNETNSWIFDSLNIQSKDEDWWGPKETSFSHRHEIFASGGKAKTEPFDYMNNFLPSWQVHPMVPSAGYGFPYNYDIWQVHGLADAIVHAGANQEVVVSPQVNAVYNETSPESIEAAKGQNNWAVSYTRPTLDVSEPFSVITFPIYDSLETVKLDLTKNHSFVGITTFSLYWRELIQNILPTDSKIIVVFEDPCAPSFTYRLDGPRAIFMGPGDLHDPKFDEMKHSAQLPDMVNSHNEAEESSYSSYTGLPIAKDFCTRTISVYPSNDMQLDYSTEDPLLFTISAACIFLFTSMVFVVYDWWVNRRQQIVMQRALASGAIVSSLFPSNVRQQLYDEEQQKLEKEKGEKDFTLSQTTSMDTSGSMGGSHTRPIADQFQHTTIFFADLVGFTAWSKHRTPTEVFELLEAIYGQFDKIAAVRQVFKIETIGDCYVAVTGIPNPQKHHAAIMARFANDCLGELHHVTHRLADKLGEDTRGLAMRVGLHSGSVTAGVLRGEKGRFQLFGDSVNTAARIEQNGKAGQIHVSEGCANALIASGKERWLVPREDKIVAKGLGELDTFWLVMRKDDTRTIGTSAGSDEMDRSLAQHPDVAPSEDMPPDEYSESLEV